MGMMGIVRPMRVMGVKRQMERRRVLILAAAVGLVWTDVGGLAQGIYAVTRRTRIHPAMGVFVPPVTAVVVNSLPLPNTAGQGQGGVGLGVMPHRSAGSSLSVVDAAEVERRTIEFQVKRAKEGSAYAQYDLGLRHWAGDGVALDRAEAIRLMEQSAKAGNTRATMKLAEWRREKP